MKGETEVKERNLFAWTFSQLVMLMIFVPILYRTTVLHESIHPFFYYGSFIFAMVIGLLGFDIIGLWLPAATKKSIENKSEWSFASLVAVPAYLATIGVSFILGVASVFSLFERNIKNPSGVWVMFCLAIVLFITTEIFHLYLKRKRLQFQTGLENELQLRLGPDTTE